MTTLKRCGWLLLVLLFSVPIFGEQAFNVIDQTENALYMHFALPEFSLQKADLGQLPDLIYPSGFYQEGMPNLPIYSVAYGLPASGDPRMTIEVTRADTLYNVDIAPWHEPTLTSAAYKGDVYRENAFYPAEQGKIGEPGIMRDVRMGALSLSPLRYNPVTKQLIVMREATIRVDFNRSAVGQNELTREDGPASKAFDEVAKSMLINYDRMPQRSTFVQPRLLIIYCTASDSDVLALLNPLIEWKHQMGYQVTAVSTSVTGVTTTSIKSYLQNLYNNAATRPDFVMLVGDAGSSSWGIPTWSSTWDSATGCSDHQYALLNGTDQVEDVFIGRMSAGDATTLRIMMAKIFLYEKNMPTDNTVFYNKVALVGDPSSSGASTRGTNKTIKEYMSAYHPAYQFSELYSGVSATSIDNLLNQGCSYWNYRGYIGMSGWAYDSHTGINNPNMLPVCVIITCGTGSFDSGTSPSEAITRLGTLSSLKGGVCAIGTATSHTQTSINNTLNTSIFEGLFSTPNLRTIGQALQYGKSMLVYNYGVINPELAAHFSCIDNLIGDPSLQVLKGLPVSMTVTAPATIAPGTDQMDVLVTDAGGQPVADAWVTAVMGSDTIFSTGYTDARGHIYLNVNTSTLGTGNLTVTKTGYYTYTGTFNVAISENSLTMGQIVVDDDASGESSGNCNNAVNPGETIELRVQVSNNGTTTLNGLTAVLTTSTPGITITDNTEIWSSISPNASAYCVDDFGFSVPTSFLGGDELVFNVAFSANGNTWNKQIKLDVSGVNLQFSSASLDDNNRLDPLETTTMLVTLANLGNVLGLGVTGVLSCNNPQVTISNPNMEWGAVFAGGTTECAAPVNITTGVLNPGSQVTMSLALTALGGYNHTITWNMSVGISSVRDPLGPDPYGYYIFDNNDNYDIAPTYNWVDISTGGTNLNLTDSGDDGDITNSTSLVLPFAFPFYGHSNPVGTHVSVCSNGWFCFGVTEQIEHRNHHLPGNSGPGYMVAPFWDDLTRGSGNCYYYNDTTNHRLIIMWKNFVSYYGSHPESFEAILLDPAYYPTPTGDGQIIFQYNTVNNMDTGYPTGSHVEPANYATVGIQNGDHSIGLEYTFGNIYPSSCPTLAANMALLITTKPGTVIGLPSVHVDNTSLNFAVPAGGTGGANLVISNAGTSALSYSLSTNYRVGDAAVTRNSGGPDGYGYRWADSATVGGPTYSWFDIANVGTPVNFSSTDNALALVNLPFTFDFYGTARNAMNISTNGFVTFNTASTATGSTNTAFSTSSTLKDGIALFWDDLHQRNGHCYTYYDQPNSRYIVEYSNWGFLTNTTSNITMQLQLFANGRIMMLYQNVNATTNSATVGIINSTGGIYLQANYNSAYITSQFALTFVKIPNWLTYNNANGSINPGATTTINLTGNSGNMSDGEYTCDLVITSNDMAHNNYSVPITMYVGSRIPRQPQHMTVNKQGNVVQISWDPVTTDTSNTPLVVNGYRIYRCLVGDNNYYLMGHVTGNQYYDISTRDNSYLYHITAYTDN